MRILLLVPKGNGPGDGKRWNRLWPDELEQAIETHRWKLVTPGVLVLAALTDLSRCQMDVVDEDFQDFDQDVHYDVAAMYTVTPNVGRAYHLADHFRSRGTHTVMGGVHATVCPDEAARHADTILIGECEYIWPEFLQDLAQHRARPRYIQPIGQVNLDDSPTPLFELLPPNGKKLVPLQTARGCPHGCGFCNLRSIYGKVYRHKKIERVDRELQAIMAVNPRAFVYFTDDNLFCHSQHSRKLLDMLGSYGVTWYANSDVSFGRDDGLIRMAYKSGCRQVLIGFESLNRANLNGIDEDNFKSMSLATYREIIERIQSNGIGVIGSFIVGFDQDSQETFEALENFIRDSGLYGANVTVNTPYPGTRMFEKMNREGKILTYNWDEYTIFQPVVACQKMDVQSLDAGYLALLAQINSPAAAMRRREHFKKIILNIARGEQHNV